MKPFMCVQTICIVNREEKDVHVSNDDVTRWRGRKEMIEQPSPGNDDRDEARKII